MKSDNKLTLIRTSARTHTETHEIVLRSKGNEKRKGNHFGNIDELHTRTLAHAHTVCKVMTDDREGNEYTISHQM